MHQQNVAVRERLLMQQVGAAAFMGGSTRMTLTTTVMVMETTGALQLIVPLMLTVFVAKARPLSLSPWSDLCSSNVLLLYHLSCHQGSFTCYLNLVVKSAGGDRVACHFTPQPCVALLGLHIKGAPSGLCIISQWQQDRVDIRQDQCSLLA